VKVDPTPAKMRRPDSARTLIWDAQDHLAAVHASTLIEAYAWTDDGRMAARYTSSGLSESFVYAGPQMVSSYTPSNALTWEAVWGPDLDDLLEFDSAAAGLQVPVRDRRGSSVRRMAGVEMEVAAADRAGYAWGLASA